MKKSKSAKRKRSASESEAVRSSKIARHDKETSQPWINDGMTGCARTAPPPTVLPLVTQHNLLQYVQHLLEDMCLAYGKRWCLAEMQKRRWTEPRSLELQCWVRFLRRHTNLIPPEAPSLQPPLSEPDLFTRVVNIRHLGVHRRNLNLPSILRLLDAAQKFAALHHDSPTCARILRITTGVREIYENLIFQQGSHENELQFRIHEIRVQQTALEHKARTETEVLKQKVLTEAGNRIGSLLCAERQHEDRQFYGPDSPSYESSDIDEILMEAAALMAAP